MNKLNSHRHNTQPCLTPCSTPNQSKLLPALDKSHTVMSPPCPVFHQLHKSPTLAIAPLCLSLSTLSYVFYRPHAHHQHPLFFSIILSSSFLTVGVWSVQLYFFLNPPCSSRTFTSVLPLTFSSSVLTYAKLPWYTQKTDATVVCALLFTSLLVPRMTRALLQSSMCTVSIVQALLTMLCIHLHT